VAPRLPTPLLPAQSALPYEADIQAFERADELSPPPEYPVLFLGSSTFRMWTTLASDFPGYQVLNRGFGGSQISDVLNHYPRLVTRYQPPLIFFYEGDNDLASGKSVDAVFADWQRFLARVEADLPKTGVAFVAVKPSPSRRDHLDRQRQLNDRIRDQLAGHPRHRYVDVFNPMLTEAGEPRPELFLNDNLHLNPSGYALWTERLTPVFQAWDLAYPTPSIRSPSQALWIDWGHPDALPQRGTPGVADHWNSAPIAFASQDHPHPLDLVAANGRPTGIQLRLIRPFQGLDQTGTTNIANLPPLATRDSVWSLVDPARPESQPSFEFEGLDVGQQYTLECFASRTGTAGDYQTRWLAQGATTVSADQFVSGNPTGLTPLPGVQPDATGRLRVTLELGPDHQAAQTAVHLGLLRLSWAPAPSTAALFDLGASAFVTSPSGGTPTVHWNNLTAGQASTPGPLTGLVDVNGAPLPFGLVLLQRFNGANENGTSSSTRFPASATRDSLFGNTASFGGLSNVFPAFRWVDLKADQRLTLTFFASRTGVNDNRETRYTVTGDRQVVVDLNAANNLHDVAVVTDLAPDAQGHITVRLSPGPRNTNTQRFTYLGVLRLDWHSASAPSLAQLKSPAYGPDFFRFQLHAQAGKTYRVERSLNLLDWHPMDTLPMVETSRLVAMALDADHAFFRARETAAPAQP
jgi:lysophospholipase L1-like esterase